MNIILYFCGVKTYLRYEAAAQKQRFLCHLISIKNKRIEWGRSNRPKATADKCLTARNALSLLSKNLSL